MLQPNCIRDQKSSPNSLGKEGEGGESSAQTADADHRRNGLCMQPTEEVRNMGTCPADPKNLFGTYSSWLSLVNEED